MAAAPVERVPVSVETRAPTGRTYAYLVDGLLVDPADRTPELDALVENRTVDHVAVTHSHPDHVAGVAAYADATGATVWARQGHADRFEAAIGISPDRTFRDGDRVGPARAVGTPGHAPDHAAFAVEDDRGGRVLLCGDLAVAEGSVVVGAPEGDVRAYLTSLRRVRAGSYDALYPAHGPPIDDPDATVERLIRHRLDREERVLATVRSGAGDLDAVLDAAYEKDLAGVEDLARMTVAAHLLKLARAGRIDREWLDRVG